MGSFQQEGRCALGFAILLAFVWASAGALGLNLPPNTEPLYVDDPVLPDSSSDTPGFAGFGACGPSCDCVGREDGSTETCSSGQRCTWETVSCKTDSFCRWHDGCYRTCDFQYPGTMSDGSIGRVICYRSCDYSCITGDAPEIPGGWTVAAPSAPPEALGFLMCARRLAKDPTVPFDGVTVYAGNPNCVADPRCQ